MSYVYSETLSNALQLTTPRSKIPFYFMACLIFAGSMFFTNEVAESSFSPYIPEPQQFIQVKSVVSAYTDFIKIANSNLSDETAAEIVRYAIKWAKEFKLDEKLILAIIAKESTFDPHAISSSGALGLMQVVPKWHLDKIIKARDNLDTPELFNIETNIYIGSMIYKDCRNKYRQLSSSLKCYEGSINKKTGYDDAVIIRYNELKKSMKGTP